MNKTFIMFLAGFVAPFIIAWMIVRHPVITFKELYKSWMLVFRGKDLE